MKELSLHCSRLDLHVAQMTTQDGNPVSSWRLKNIVKISALVLIPCYTQIKCIFLLWVRVDYISVCKIFKETNFYTGILYIAWPYFQVFNSCSKKFILQKTLISHSLWKKQYTYRALYYHRLKISFLPHLGKFTTRPNENNAFFLY